MVEQPNGAGWTNSLSINGCLVSWDVDHNTTNLFGKGISLFHLI